MDYIQKYLTIIEDEIRKNPSQWLLFREFWQIMKIAVVIPAHNEAQTIGPLVEAVRALGYDCIVIDDGSVDETDAMAAQAGAVVLKTAGKSGKGNALKVGFDHVLRMVMRL